MIKIIVLALIIVGTISAAFLLALLGNFEPEQVLWMGLIRPGEAQTR